MKTYEVFAYHKKMGNNLFAAIAAVDIAMMKASRAGRSSWLDSACEIMPEWREAADIADLTADFEPIYVLIGLGSSKWREGSPWASACK